MNSSLTNVNITLQATPQTLFNNSLEIGYRFNPICMGHHNDISRHNPTLKECEDETHTPKIGTWESSGTPETLEFDCRSQNTLH
jgi:hypothetical protein